MQGFTGEQLVAVTTGTRAKRIISEVSSPKITFFTLPRNKEINNAN